MSLIYLITAAERHSPNSMLAKLDWGTTLQRAGVQNLSVIIENQEFCLNAPASLPRDISFVIEERLIAIGLQ